MEKEIIELKARAFDLLMQIKIFETQYKQVLQLIEHKENEPRDEAPVKENE